MLIDSQVFNVKIKVRFLRKEDRNKFVGELNPYCQMIN